MNKLFTYTIELQDKMSSTFRRVGVSIDETHKRVESLRGQIDKLNNTPLTGLTNSIGGVFKKVSQQIPFARYFLNPIALAGVAGGRALKLGIDEEMRGASFEVLFSGEENAKRMIDQIDAYSKKTTYGKDGLSSAVQMMAGFGIAQERIMPNLSAIGEIAMGNKQQFDSLTLAFSQMSAIGTLMGQDLNQMINAGFNPLQQISKDTGKSVGELREEMNKGLITADMVAEAFQNATKEGGMFYGLSQRVGQEFGGMISLGIKIVTGWLLKAYNVLKFFLFPIVKAFIGLATDFRGFFADIIDRISRMNTVAKIGLGILASLTTAMVIMKGVTLAYSGVLKLLTIMKSAETRAWIANAVAMWANPIMWIVAGVVALIAGITFLIVKVDGWGETWSNVLEYAKLAFTLFKDNVVLMWLKVQNAFMTGLEVIKIGWYKLQSLWNKDAANEGLAAIEAQRNKRLESIAEQQGKLNELKEQMSGMKVFQLKLNDTSFSDVVRGAKQKLGIEPAGIPGTESTSTGSTSAGGGKGASAKTANSIATGGSKTTHVTINLGSLVESMNINSGNIREGADKVRDIVLDELSRALLMAQANV